MSTEPEFPVRIILDDGETIVLNEPDDLFDHFTTLDSIDPAAGVWARDDLGRTVRILMRDSMIERFELV